MSDSNQELRNRLDLALFEALTAWLPKRDRQPAVNVLTEAAMSALQDQGLVADDAAPRCNVCGKPPEVLDTEYDEYFCLSCAQNYEVLDGPHRYV